MAFFLELTQSNGQPLDLPLFSVLLVETLDKDTSSQQNEAKSGVLYDVGSGLQSVTVMEPFGKIQTPLMAERGTEFVELRSALNNPMLLLKSGIVSLRGLGDEHQNAGKTQLSQRVGQQILTLDVLNTRDEIREKIDG